MRTRTASAVILIAMPALLAAAGGAEAAYTLASSAITPSGSTGMAAGPYSLSAGMGTTGAGPSQAGAYKLTAGFWTGTGGSSVDVPEDETAPPVATELLTTSPNPFSRSTMIAFDLAQAAAVHIELFDVAGRRVCTLLDGSQQPGRYHVSWSGNDQAGRPVASGIYIVSFRSGDVHATRRVVKLR